MVRRYLQALLVGCVILEMAAALMLWPPIACAQWGSRRVAEPSRSLVGPLGVATEDQPLISGLPRWRGGCLRPFVNLYSGGLVLRYDAFSAPAIGFDWDLSFFYNTTLAGEVTTIGRGWRHSYDIALQLNTPPGSITVRWGDGRRDVFTPGGGGWNAAAPLEGRQIVAIAGGYRLTDKHGLRHEFDTVGRLVRLVDLNANTMTFAYDGLGRLASVSDASSRTLTFTYNGAGRVSTIGGLTPQTITLTYSSDRLTSIAESPGFPNSFQYDGLNRLVRISDGGSLIAHVSYYPSLNVVQWLRTAIARRDFLFDQGTLTTTVRDSIGPAANAQTAYRFNANGTVASVMNQGLGSTTNTYDPALLKPLGYTDVDGHTWSYTYSAVGDLLTATEPTTSVWTWTYDPTHHLPATLVDPASGLWRWQRDGAGNLLSFVDPLLDTWSWTYDVLGQVQNQTDPLTNTTTFGHDSDGNLTSVTDPMGNSVQASYDSRGNMVTVSDQLSNMTQLIRDGRDDVVNINYPLGGFRTLEWFPDGRPKSDTDPDGNATKYEYDGLSRLVRIVSASAETTKVQRDGAGRAIEKQDASGAKEQYQYDGVDRIIRKTDQSNGVWNFLFDPFDLDKIVTPKGDTLDVDRDALHRPTQLQSADGTTTYTYDNVDRLIVAKRVAPAAPTIEYHFVYDAAWRLIQKQSVHLNRTVNFTPDAAGQIAQMSDNLQPIPWVYTRDSRNLVTDLSGLPDFELGAYYSSRHELTNLYINPVGVSCSMNHDALGRVSSVSNYAPGFSSYHSLSFTPGGNITNLDMYTPTSGSVSMAASYDPSRRVLTENYAGGPSFAFTYGAGGDRLTKDGPGGLESSFYTGGHRLVAAGTLAQTWNLDGDVTQVTWPGNTITNVYRADRSLKSLTHNGATWQFVPGPFGEIALVVDSSGAASWRDEDQGPSGLLRLASFAAPNTAPIEEIGYFEGDRRPIPRFRKASGSLWPLTAGPFGSGEMADGSGNLASGRVYTMSGELLAQTGTPSPSPGFLDMIALKEDELPDLAGSSSHPATGGLPPDTPYLARTGSLLRDLGFGPDVLTHDSRQVEANGGGNRWGPASISAYTETPWDPWPYPGSFASVEPFHGTLENTEELKRELERQRREEEWEKEMREHTYNIIPRPWFLGGEDDPGGYFYEDEWGNLVFVPPKPKTPPRPPIWGPAPDPDPDPVPGKEY